MIFAQRHRAAKMKIRREAREDHPQFAQITPIGETKTRRLEQAARRNKLTQSR